MGMRVRVQLKLLLITMFLLHILEGISCRKKGDRNGRMQGQWANGLGVLGDRELSSTETKRQLVPNSEEDLDLGGAPNDENELSDIKDSSVREFRVERERRNTDQRKANPAQMNLVKPPFLVAKDVLMKRTPQLQLQPQSQLLFQQQRREPYARRVVARSIVPQNRNRDIVPHAPITTRPKIPMSLDAIANIFGTQHALNPGRRSAAPNHETDQRSSVVKNMSTTSINIPVMDAKEVDIPLSSFDVNKLTPQERSLLLSLENKSTSATEKTTGIGEKMQEGKGKEKVGEKRQNIMRPFTPESYEEEDRHDIMRRRLLEALSRRIEARNLLMHEKALLRQRMLQDQLQEARNNYAQREEGLARDKVIRPMLMRPQRMGETPLDYPRDEGIRSHEIGPLVEPAEPEYSSNSMHEIRNEGYRRGAPIARETDRMLQDQLNDQLQEARNNYARREEGLARDKVIRGKLEEDMMPASQRLEPMYGREANIIRSHVSRDYPAPAAEPEMTAPPEEDVRRDDIRLHGGRHFMEAAPDAVNGLYGDPNAAQQQQQQQQQPIESIFEQPRSHTFNPYERKSELLHGMRVGEAMLPRNDLYRERQGNVGEDGLAYGGLGANKERNMIGVDPLLLRHHPKILPTEEGDEVTTVDGGRVPKEKKTWVTDVNVYSKKKKMDDIAELFSDDGEESDALDEFDPCEKKPCQNGGVCKIVGNTHYKCLCPRSHRGHHCGTKNHCHSNPCAHGSACTETAKGFKCSCTSGWKGKRCRERNYCLPNPCGEHGVCMLPPKPGGKYECACKDEWHGKTCQEKKTTCSPNPCLNGGHCLTDGTNFFQCLCLNGTMGKFCEESKGDTSLATIAQTFNIPGEHAIDDMSSLTDGDISNSLNTNTNTRTANVKSSISFPPPPPPPPVSLRPSACLSHPCLHGGSCMEDPTTAFGFKCECIDKYAGEICEEKKCMCRNGGQCIGEGVEEKCICKGGYAGPRCEEHTQCNEDTCMHGGICIEEVGGFKCKCDQGFKGSRCEVEDRCRPNPCLHGGTCKNYGKFHKCECSKGFKGKSCEDLDLCEPNPCQNGGQCFSYSGGYQCECKENFSGRDCAERNHCVSNPCSNGAECIEIRADIANPQGSYKCGCRPGFTGDKCDSEDFCHSNPCHNGGKCTNSNVGFVCQCIQQYSGPQCQLINHCFQNPCKNGKCIPTMDSYKCECDVGYKGDRCSEVDFCQPNPCHNNGFCTGNEANDGFVCHCSEGYQGLECNDPDPCFPNPCSHGNCSDVAGGFVCKCYTGFKGAKCNEVDRCDPNPCFHNGNCEEINGGEGFTCLCSAGYKGRMCEHKDLCKPNPCHNEGLCEEFPPPAILPYVHHNKYSKKYNEMSEYERDIIEGDGGVQCTCMKGFHGKRCDQVDPCYPNPCLHEGICLFNGHFPVRCNCSSGWKGEHCHVVDLCSPDPCRYGTHCRQNDEESYQCVRSLCSPNPCSHGGKCIVVNDESYECACPKGFKGALCEESDQCQPNPCNNDGICRNTLEGKSECVCRPQWSGQFCDEKVDKAERNSVPAKKERTKSYCGMTPCKNGGSCIDTESGFTCRCTYGFAGPFCEDSVCFPSPCHNDGVCVPYYGIALCKCLTNYTGAHCSENKMVNSMKPYNINIGKDGKDVQSVTKSETPHILSQQLKSLDPTSPALITRVEEILNSYNDPAPSLIQQKQQAAILQNALAANPGLAAKAKMVIPGFGVKPINGSGVENVRNELPAVPGIPVMNADTPGSIITTASAYPAPENPAPENAASPVPASPAPESPGAGVNPTASMNTGTIQPTVGVMSTSERTASDRKFLTEAKEKQKEANKESAENEKVRKETEKLAETVGAVPETNPNLDKKKKNQPTLAIDVVASGTKNDELGSDVPINKENAKDEERKAENDKFESIGSVPDKCEPNPCRHGGTCVIRSNGDPECICTENFSGPECRDVGKLGYSSGPKFFPHDECNHCDKEAICVNKHCICDKGFVGDGLECWPETTMDRKWDCDPNPCQNGGTCKKGRARCVCRLGYIGLFCENYCEPCVHLSFDKTNGPYIIDESGHHNNAIMKNGAFIANNGGKCDSGVSPSGGDVLFGGKHFAPKPYDAITLVVWVNVDTVTGIQSVFDTVGGPLSSHREGQYHLEVDNSRIRWFHRNERHNTIFSVTSGPVIWPKNWTHVAGTYNAAKRLALLYVNGDLVGTNTNVGSDVNLSQDWDTKAGLGRHEHTFGNRVYHGVIDEFYIFPCTLPRLEILVLMHHCKVYWKKKKKDGREELKRPVDPIFDIDTALQTKPTSIKAENVIALSETAKALEKDLKKFQSYYGLNKKNFDKHKKEFETTGDSRFQISKPNPAPQPVARIPHPALAPAPAQQHADQAARRGRLSQKKEGKAAEYMSVMPNGPTSMVAEVQGLLTTELGNKRMQIHPNGKVQTRGKSLIAKNNPVTFSHQYHRAPVVRNENKVLPFGPHAYFQQESMRPGLARSSFPRQLNNNAGGGGPSPLVRGKPNPRWFSWTKGLATTQGTTTTNTHSNSKTNEPGKLNLANHVSSSQSSDGQTSIKQRYGFPPSPYARAPPHATVNAQKVEQARRIAAATAKRHGMLMQAQRKAAAARNRMVAAQRYHRPGAQKKDENEGDVHTTEHKHQWGFGNGNGNGHGVGTPGASGSGGGWGAGGPINGKVNFPNWNPPPGRFAPPSPARGRVSANPPVSREMWNAFLAQKRQSTTNVGAQTENKAQSVVNIEPANGLVDAKVLNHQWGFGNGNGQGKGGGRGGGTGSGGGWGAGGPTKQEQWMPPGQPPPDNQNQQRSVIPKARNNPRQFMALKPQKPVPNVARSFIHNGNLPLAIAHSYKAPWLPQNTDKVNSHHGMNSHQERRGQAAPPAAARPHSATYFATVYQQQQQQQRRSNIPKLVRPIPNLQRPTYQRPVNPYLRGRIPQQQQRRTYPPPPSVRSPPQSLQVPYQKRNKVPAVISSNVRQQYNKAHTRTLEYSRPIKLVKHFSIPRPPLRAATRTRKVPPAVDPQSRSHIRPMYPDNKLFVRPPYRSPVQKRTVIPHSDKPDALTKHLTPQGIIETLPFLRKRDTTDYML